MQPTAARPSASAPATPRWSLAAHRPAPTVLAPVVHRPFSAPAERVAPVEDVVPVRYSRSLDHRPPHVRSATVIVDSRPLRLGFMDRIAIMGGALGFGAMLAYRVMEALR